MELTDRIHLLQIDFEIAINPEKRLARSVNVLIVFSDQITLIDTGVKGSEQGIFDYIREQKRDPSEIARIILSHSHPDHIGSAAKIKELTGCRILANPAEQEWIEQIEIQNKERPVPGFYNLVDTSVKIDDFISNGQEIQAGTGLTLQFIHAPGHSKGSLNILFKEDMILFTADSIPLRNDIPNYDNYHDLMNSMERIRKSTENEMLLTSWTPPLRSRKEILRKLDEGREYMEMIDSAVRDCYKGESVAGTDPCKCTVARLGLPPFLANPIVDKAFRSHLQSDGLQVTSD